MQKKDSFLQEETSVKGHEQDLKKLLTTVGLLSQAFYLVIAKAQKQAYNKELLETFENTETMLGTLQQAIGDSLMSQSADWLNKQYVSQRMLDFPTALEIMLRLDTPFSTSLYRRSVQLLKKLQVSKTRKLDFKKYELLFDLISRELDRDTSGEAPRVSVLNNSLIFEFT